MNGFAIVDFTLEKSTDFVPVNWIQEDYCLWPADEGKSLNSSQVKERENPASVPDRKWRKVPISIKYLSGGKESRLKTSGLVIL